MTTIVILCACLNLNGLYYGAMVVLCAIIKSVQRWFNEYFVLYCTDGKKRYTLPFTYLTYTRFSQDTVSRTLSNYEPLFQINLVTQLDQLHVLQLA